jgi:hypothetical protein
MQGSRFRKVEKPAVLHYKKQRRRYLGRWGCAWGIGIVVAFWAIVTMTLYFLYRD